MEPEPDDIPEDVRSNSSLSTWINKERFPKFVKVTRARFSHLLSTKKLLVMAVLDENKIGQISPEMDEFRY
jgi:thioredoxin domain-containing protein 10